MNTLYTRDAGWKNSKASQIPDAADAVDGIALQIILVTGAIGGTPLVYSHICNGIYKASVALIETASSRWYTIHMSLCFSIHSFSVLITALCCERLCLSFRVLLRSQYL